ncbi:MAG: lysozyme inhibitor LprI family protein, partial [Pseudomonadota bacterium]
MRPLSLVITLLGVVCIASCSANAQAPDPETCSDTARTNTEFAACGQARIDKAQSRLDAEYLRLLISMRENSNKQAVALIEEQSAWKA